MIGGFNLSIAVLIVHGWMYVVYLISNFRLWSLMRWPFTKLIVLALGGVVPFLSFFVEKKSTLRSRPNSRRTRRRPSGTEPQRY